MVQECDLWEGDLCNELAMRLPRQLLFLTLDTRQQAVARELGFKT